MLVGLLASIAAFGFAKTMGEPQISLAVAFEEQAAQSRGESPEKPLVSRAVQEVGLGAGLAVSGSALGGLFGLAFAFAYRRIARRSAQSTAALLAGVAFLALYGVPFLKYPANPPSVGNSDTIGRRTSLYLALVVLSGLLVVLGGLVRGRLKPTLGPWNATLAAIILFCVMVAIVYVVMPGVNEVPPEFPYIVLWRFRLASIGIQVILWATIGVAFGAFTERAEQRASRVSNPVTA